MTVPRDDAPDLHVVSVSLGSPTRDSRIATEMLGQRILFERRGTGGDIRAAGDMVAELDGQVDAIGLGGIDLFIQAAGRRYPLGDAQRIAARAERTPVVCGAGLKDTLERRVVEELDVSIGWSGKRVLMLAAVDRFGMAEELARQGADLRMGDLAFALGIPVLVRELATIATIARFVGPALRYLPHAWLYPTGDKQEAGESGWRERYFRDVDVIAGDFLYVKRYAPKDLTGAIVLTNTTTRDDVEMLRERGVRTLITTTPRFAGRSLSTNLLEAGLVALAGRYPLAADDYHDLIGRIGLGPTVVHLNEAPEPAA